MTCEPVEAAHRLGGPPAGDAPQKATRFGPRCTEIQCCVVQRFDDPLVAEAAGLKGSSDLVLFSVIARGLGLRVVNVSWLASRPALGVAAVPHALRG